MIDYFNIRNEHHLKLGYVYIWLNPTFKADQIIHRLQLQILNPEPRDEICGRYIELYRETIMDIINSPELNEDYFKAHSFRDVDCLLVFASVGKSLP